MSEAELTSELVIAMLDGLQQGKTTIKVFYKKYDERLPQGERIRREFNAVIDLISQCFGETLQHTRFRRRPLFYSLFTAFYDARFGLPKSRKRRVRLTSGVLHQAREALIDVNSRIQWNQPQPEYSSFVTACEKGTAFLQYRQIRHDFIWTCLFGKRVAQ